MTTETTNSPSKPCIICGEWKNIDQFYKHAQMGDGHLNKCKQCTKDQSRARHYDKYANDPSFIESERERGREKYHRLVYKEKQKENDSNKPWKQDQKYKGLFLFLKRRGLISDNENAHHWNYNEINNVFVLNKHDHRFIHTKIRVDEELLLFRDKDTGFVLNNYEDHVDLLEGYGIEFRHVVI